MKGETTMSSNTTLKELFETYLANFEEVLVLVKNSDGLQLPDHVMPKGDATLVLVYGLDLATPIEDLEIDDTGIRSTLSFQRTPWPTFVPWTSLYMMQGFRSRPKQREKLRLV